MKYIVDNLPSQSITGDLSVNGSLSVITDNYRIATYRALLTQTGSITGTSLNDFPNYSFIIGETYTIISYNPGDDFSNIANVISGSINTSGCEFIATGETPLTFSGSTVQSSGNLVTTVLENTLGYDLSWFQFQVGTYFAFNNDTGPMYNSFPKGKVSVQLENTAMEFGPPPPAPVINYGLPAGLGTICELIAVVCYDYNTESNIDDYLYYTPIEIKVKQNASTTPVIVTGTVEASFPILYPGLRLVSGEEIVEAVGGSNNPVSNLSELINYFNSSSEFNFLGTFSADEGGTGIQLTTTAEIEEQFSPDRPFTIQAFND
jgi:hypothetical protein